MSAGKGLTALVMILGLASLTSCAFFNPYVICPYTNNLYQYLAVDGNILYENEMMTTGQYLTSQMYGYRAAMQYDGTFGIIDTTTNSLVWVARMVKNTCNFIILRSDGNLVISNKFDNSILWSSKSIVSL